MSANRNHPLVVVCLATYNGAAFIEETLQTLAAQTYPNLKVLVSDDTSTDATLALCQAFAARDSRFHVRQQSRRLGWMGNVNALLQIADGDYLFFMPHDDRLEPTYVARLVAALEAHPRAILAFADLERINVTGERQTLTYTELEGIASPVERGARMLQQQGSWWVPYRGIFRAAAVKQFRCLRRSLAGEFIGDWLWLLGMTLLGEFVRVPEVLYQKIDRKQSLSRTWKFTPRPLMAATLACSAEIQRSPLSLTAKLPLQALAIRICLQQLLHGIQSQLERRRPAGAKL